MVNPNMMGSVLALKVVIVFNSIALTDVVAMAAAFALAIEAGRLACEADPMEPRDMAAPSTPVVGKAFL